MKHLILCNEYPPVPNAPGGIGTYVLHIAQLLADSGETVHVISQRWAGAPKKIEHQCDGRLIIHRVPFLEWKSPFKSDPISDTKSQELEGLLQSAFPPQSFAWQASLLAEKLVEEEGIDIIESQDFQSPLYYFQLRRALGFGPKRKPPCLIHLHSPTEFIALHNNWDINYPFMQTAKRLEDYSIATADALLCPSQYLARQAEIHYGLEANSIQVIPLPIGDSPLLKRDQDTWKQGTICYVGRLEERKGVVEWIDAAVSVARDYPMAQFEFIGANCLNTENVSGEEFLEQRIPAQLRARFHFRGKQERSALPAFLKQARIAVVPSRWENFPNTCVEAMCSGLPVIASREGGMVEMIEDGRTGWLASQSGSEGLAEALKRALETPPSQLAEMGDAASVSIRQLCDNQKTVESQIAFRQEIVDRAAKRSLFLPVNLPWSNHSFSTPPTLRSLPEPSEQGIAVVVVCFEAEHLLQRCLNGLKQQNRAPETVMVITNEATGQRVANLLDQARSAGWFAVQQQGSDLTLAKNTAIEKILGTGVNPIGFAFLDTGDQLEADFISSCELVLRNCPDVGLVSCWAKHIGARNQFWIKPCPSFPYQWVTDEVVPFGVVRTEALRQAGNFRFDINQRYESWDLFNTMMALGWVAVTIPAILGTSRLLQEGSIPRTNNIHAHNAVRRRMLTRFPDLIAHDLSSIAQLLESNKAWSNHRASVIQEQMFRAHLLLRFSQGVYWFILKKIKSEALHFLGNAKYRSFEVLKQFRKRVL